MVDIRYKWIDEYVKKYRHAQSDTERERVDKEFMNLLESTCSQPYRIKEYYKDYERCKR